MFSFRTTLVALAAAAGVLAGVTPATAAGPVEVHLDVDLAVAVPVADCDVSVPSGANGLAVLDAAVAAGCIDSYSTQDFGFGAYVDCINDVCEQPGPAPVATWSIYLEDGRFAPVGVTDLQFPADGASLRFSYEPWPVWTGCFFLGVGCPPLV